MRDLRGSLRCGIPDSVTVRRFSGHRCCELRRGLVRSVVIGCWCDSVISFRIDEVGSGSECSRSDTRVVSRRRTRGVYEPVEQGREGRQGDDLKTKKNE